MSYEAYTLETLKNLGISKVLRGCKYITCSMEYLLNLDKYTIPDSYMIYRFAAQKFFLEPTAIENSMRNVIQTIWTKKENPKLMAKIFGPYNMDKRPCNMEFLMLLHNYVRLQLENTDTIRKLDKLWNSRQNKV